MSLESNTRLPGAFPEGSTIIRPGLDQLSRGAGTTYAVRNCTRGEGAGIQKQTLLSFSLSPTQAGVYLSHCSAVIYLPIVQLPFSHAQLFSPWKWA